MISSYAEAGRGSRAESPLIRMRWMSSAVITSPRWMVFVAASTASVLVVAFQAHAPSRQPSAVMTTAATTRPGRLRSLGGGVIGGPMFGAPAWGPGFRSSRAVVVTLVPPAQFSSVHEHLGFANPDLGRAVEAVEADRPGLARARPGDDPARGRGDGVGVIRLAGARLPVGVAAVGGVLPPELRLVRRARRVADDLGAVAHVPGDVEDRRGRRDCDAAGRGALGDRADGVGVRVLGPHPDRHADQSDAVRTRLGRDADVDGRQMHLLDRDLRHLARRWSRAGVRGRVLGPDGDEQTRLRLIAVVDRAVAGLVTLPTRVARRRLGLDRTDVAVVTVRPVAR